MRPSLILRAAGRKPKTPVPPKPASKTPKTPSIRIGLEAYNETAIKTALEEIAPIWKGGREQAFQSHCDEILSSLHDEDPEGKIYARNTRQIAELRSHTGWLDGSAGRGRKPLGERSPRKSVLERPTTADPSMARQLARFWRLHDLRDGVVVLGCSGHPHLIDAILALPNIRKVIAIEEVPEYLYMYTDSWRRKHGDRLQLIRNEPYWWDVYTDIEERGWLADVEKVDWSKEHPSLFYGCQMPHVSTSNNRSTGLFMQLLECAVMRHWLYEYGRIRMGFTFPQLLHDRLAAPRGSTFYSRSSATIDVLGRLTSFKDGKALASKLFFPEHAPTSKGIKVAGSVPVHLDVKPGTVLKPAEYDAMQFIMKAMFIFRAQPWVNSIGNTAPNAIIMTEKLKALDQAIPEKTKTRDLTADQWVNLARAYNRWPFKPRTYETDFEDVDDEVDFNRFQIRDGFHAETAQESTEERG